MDGWNHPVMFSPAIYCREWNPLYFSKPGLNPVWIVFERAVTPALKCRAKHIGQCVSGICLARHFNAGVRFPPHIWGFNPPLDMGLKPGGEAGPSIPAINCRAKHMRVRPKSMFALLQPRPTVRKRFLRASQPRPTVRKWFLRASQPRPTVWKWFLRALQPRPNDWKRFLRA